MSLVRHRGFGGPSWLWSILEYDLELSSKGLVREPSTDEKEFLIDRYREFYAMWNCRTTSDVEVATTFSSEYGAVLTWQDNSVSSFKWLIEAMILADASDTEIAYELGDEESPATINCYRRLFFDVYNNKQRPIWMQKYLWSSATQSDPALYYVDTIYKIIAHFGGKDMLGSLFGATITDNNSKQWIGNYLETEFLKKSLQFSANYAKLDVCTRNTVHDRVMNDIKSVDSSNSGDALEAAAVMKSLSEALSANMNVMDMDSQLNSKELVRVDMYKDEDIKNGKNASS